MGSVDCMNQFLLIYLLTIYKHGKIPETFSSFGFDVSPKINPGAAALVNLLRSSLISKEEYLEQPSELIF